MELCLICTRVYRRAVTRRAFSRRYEILRLIWIFIADTRDTISYPADARLYKLLNPPLLKFIFSR